MLARWSGFRLKDILHYICRKVAWGLMLSGHQSSSAALLLPSLCMLILPLIHHSINCLICLLSWSPDRLGLKTFTWPQQHLYMNHNRPQEFLFVKILNQCTSPKTWAKIMFEYHVWSIHWSYRKLPTFVVK